MVESSGGSSSSVVGSVMGALLGGSTQSSNPSVLQRTAGTTATLGFSYFLLRLVVTTAKVIADDNNDYVDPRTRETVADLLGKSEALYQFVRNLLRRFILQQGLLRGRLVGDDECDDEEESEEENVPMIHKGSCHCRAVCFEVRPFENYWRLIVSCWLQV
jgi:hypothetical protein